MALAERLAMKTDGSALVGFPPADTLSIYKAGVHQRKGNDPDQKRCM